MKCSPENVQVTCNPVEIHRRRRFALYGYAHQRLTSDDSNRIRNAREAVKQKLTISFDMVLFPNNTDTDLDLKLTSVSIFTDLKFLKISFMIN